MKVVLSTLLQGHMYALARYLHQRNLLAHLFSSYPRWKLKNEGMPQALISTTPWFLVPYMALHRFGLLPDALERPLAHMCHRNHESFVTRHLPACDVFHGLSCHNLRAGLKARAQGARYVCDHGSSHIGYHDRILREEADIVGLPYRGVDPRMIDSEVREYGASDRIFVASKFAERTFLEYGISPEKLSVIPYGVELSRFRPVPVEPDGVFRVVYLGALSMRKGLHYLARAFAMADIPGSQLVLVGSPSAETELLLEPVKNMNVIRTGLIPREQVLTWLARASVKVLASVEDGFGLVLLEAQACGLPVIATVNTGGPDCIEDGVNGFVVPIRSPSAIAEKLVYLHDHPEHRATMGSAALQRVKSAGGWDKYGDQVLETYRTMLTR
jgi:glycosyltransferase involved in cell wall biosynthesis